MFLWGFLWLALGIALVLFLLAFFTWGLNHAIALALNSIIGFFALYAIQAFVWPTLVINVWSVIVTAIFGIFGFVFVLIMHFFGKWW